MIHNAIVKYGKKNFSFEVLGWFEDYNEKERYYISYYNSLSPNGYNIQPGGEEPPILKGENNPHTVISEEIANLIKKDLKDWSITRKTIIKKYNVTTNIIRHINEGNSWRDDKETYPLRPPETELNKKRVEKIIEMIILTDIPLNKIGEKVGWKRSSAKMINAGKKSL